MTIVGENEVKLLKKLRLAMLGYTSDVMLTGMKQLVENNQQDIEKFVPTKYHPYIRMKDGSQITGISFAEHLRGHKYDQLILVDDKRWNILTDKAVEIDQIIEQTMYMSDVPKEFQILHYLVE